MSDEQQIFLHTHPHPGKNNKPSLIMTCWKKVTLLLGLEQQLFACMLIEIGPKRSSWWWQGGGELLNYASFLLLHQRRSGSARLLLLLLIVFQAIWGQIPDLCTYSDNFDGAWARLRKCCTPTPPCHFELLFWLAYFAAGVVFNFSLLVALLAATKQHHRIYIL